MNPPLTEGIWKWYVHIPTGEKFHGFDAEDIIWSYKRYYSNKLVHENSTAALILRASIEEFVELYDI